MKKPYRFGKTIGFYPIPFIELTAWRKVGSLAMTLKNPNTLTIHCGVFKWEAYFFIKYKR